MCDRQSQVHLNSIVNTFLNPLHRLDYFIITRALFDSHYYYHHLRDKETGLWKY